MPATDGLDEIDAAVAADRQQHRDVRAPYRPMGHALRVVLDTNVLLSGMTY